MLNAYKILKIIRYLFPRETIDLIRINKKIALLY
jgi:hypothetical protein